VFGRQCFWIGDEAGSTVSRREDGEMLTLLYRLKTRNEQREMSKVVTRRYRSCCTEEEKGSYGGSGRRAVRSADGSVSEAGYV
jgi:hypothetical protein